MMKKLVGGVSFATVLALGLVGCGSGGEDTTGSAPGAAPTVESSSAPVAGGSGNVVAGHGFTLELPTGWETADYPIAGVNPDLFAIRTGDSDDFVDNINIIRDSGSYTVDELEEMSVAEYEALGVTATVGQRVDFDGTDGSHVSGHLYAQGMVYDAEQYVVSYEGTVYIVTFSYSPDFPRSDRDAAANELLATWKWN